MSARKAHEAAMENVQQYVSAQRDPVTYNMNIALANLADALLKIERSIDDVDRRVQRLQQTVDHVQSRLR